ncbi:MAG: endo-1,4-beta-xylanase [Lachnospiraceae bacterium]|nr:endo-1,4-beta-xylanase [Lachnospiraceae bacterium]
MHKISILKKYMALGLMAAMCMSGCAGGGGTGSENPPREENETATNDKDENVSETAGDQSESEGTDPILRDAMADEMGIFAGCAVTGAEVDDSKVWDIVTTHFSSVTLGNELKPDALVGYSVGKCPGTVTDELNGETIIVPKLDYSRAEKILDKILAWNEANPDREIKVRGHVLVWHSQTPEWFFHADYDKNKDYVSAGEMDKRLEWYIKTVLTHFTGQDSKYKDLFYGWDVVNEAISDGTGTYRSDNENPNESLSEDRHGSNSSWWHVYGSGEFIINAFKYANKYAPEDLELYYNDYNECNLNKRNGIVNLLEEIKAAEGAPGEGTRITAMGMQGHYGMESPSSNDILTSIQAYAKVVGRVQITELDISASEEYDGSEEAKEAEYEKLRKRYNMIKYAVTSSNLDEQVVTGITFWGTVDHYSWLQSRSNVGGGNTTGIPQCPLLFDENYEPKPCFYVFAGKK